MIGRAGTGTTSTLQEMQAARRDKMPVEDFEDRSLAYPSETNRQTEGRLVCKWTFDQLVGDVQWGELAGGSALERALEVERKIVERRTLRA
jgi:hypothetical protein